MAAATPAMAQMGWYRAPGPSFSYQSPDGSYDSYTDFSRALWGMPCGIECTHRAEVRWGLIPAHPPVPPHHHPYRYGY
ncbi:MAG: hypothetical protein ACYC5H_16310 [Methylovirgula sp.]